MKNLKYCSIEGCNNKHYGKGYCRRHYDLWRRKGFIPKRTQRDPNEFIFTYNTCKILLYDSKCNYVATAIINKKDYEKIKGYKWHLTEKGYAATDIKRKKVPLANVIMDCDSSYKIVVDHINRNKLDNKRRNLRVCSNQENQLNHKLLSSNTSGHNGIDWHKGGKKWRVRIGKKHIGLFSGLLKAVLIKNQYIKSIEK